MLTYSRRLILSVATIAAFSVFAPVSDVLGAAPNYGKYDGTATLTFGPGPRQMTLQAPFAYIDPDGKRWSVPANTKVDGASIPQAFWSVVGGPFEGAYREASVIHDHYCVTRSEPWQQVHRMFYYAMLASGTDPTKAKIMYYAVRVGGPRWKDVLYTNHNPGAVRRPGDKEEVKVESWAISYDEKLARQHQATLEKNGAVSLDQIDALADQAFNGREPADVVRTDR